MALNIHSTTFLSAVGLLNDRLTTSFMIVNFLSSISWILPTDNKITQYRNIIQDDSETHACKVSKINISTLTPNICYKALASLNMSIAILLDASDTAMYSYIAFWNVLQFVTDLYIDNNAPICIIASSTDDSELCDSFVIY